MATTLDKALRHQLEKAVLRARTIAEAGAHAALHTLGVATDLDKHLAHLSPAQRDLRRRLRRHGGQLLGKLTVHSAADLDPLAEEIAYEHWHRMLFARFLAENQLLIHPDFGTAVTLAECDELTEDNPSATNGYELAARFAAGMLPQIFRPHALAFEVTLAPEHQVGLERLVAGLDAEVFQSSDGLGWVYQFWQAKRKEDINKSGDKIGARQLPAVTQLFTEPYMVSFLLDNALGAWWAHRTLAPEVLAKAASEHELRSAAAIPGVPLEYLRFVRTGEDGSGPWTPAAGTFDGWPDTLAELTMLDPCCGSGHFLVGVFHMLVPMRMQLEGLSPKHAIDAVLSQNLHGLELDQRCVELAVFAVALEAWRYPGAGGYRALPTIRIACSGIAPSADKSEWDALGPHKRNIGIPFAILQKQFEHAPTLGSLIDPEQANKFGVAEWDMVAAALRDILQENGLGAEKETVVAAQDLAEAASLLMHKYSWVVTNVPYLGRGNQSSVLQDFCAKYYPRAKSDLATVFLQRCLNFNSAGGTSSIVLPQNWLFLTSYRKFREQLLREAQWDFVARLGSGAFETISGEVVKAILITLTKAPQASGKSELFGADAQHLLRGLDVSDAGNVDDKASGLRGDEMVSVSQAGQLGNPDAPVVLGAARIDKYLYTLADGVHGLGTKDGPMFNRYFWEVSKQDPDWEFMQTSTNETQFYSGMQAIVYWQKGKGELCRRGAVGQAVLAGAMAYGKPGVTVSPIGELNCSLYIKSYFYKSTATIVPIDEAHVAAIFEYIKSDEYTASVRKIDSKVAITNRTLVKVPFDLPHWQAVAAERYPNGLPEPYANDPTQWLFHGHPCGSVVWDEDTKWTADGPLRHDATVLHVAVARLLGYRWPAEVDPDMHLAVSQRAWVERCNTLVPHADADGIVCLPPVSQELAAADRLTDLLRDAYGAAYQKDTLQRLLLACGHKGSLKKWLRDKFFKEHCKLFGNRPFVWHIWDGLDDGFSALVNYHRLDYKGLESLIHRYLSDWITQQQRDAAARVDGAEGRVAAAQSLKARLEKILIGEAPLDIFVRWKSLAEQPSGWHPDLNDGVRLNIRPFMYVEDVRYTGAGVLRVKPNVKWGVDRGKDVESAPWYGVDGGVRNNDRHLGLGEKGAGS